MLIIEIMNEIYFYHFLYKGGLKLIIYFLQKERNFDILDHNFRKVLHKIPDFELLKDDINILVNMVINENNLYILENEIHLVNFFVLTYFTIHKFCVVDKIESIDSLKN